MGAFGMNSLKDKIIGAAKSGEFLPVCSSLRTGESQELKKILIKLHNEGAVNVVEEFARLESGGTPTSEFFTLRFLFEEILPDLVAEVKTVCMCVKDLVDRAGQDMAAGQIWNSYQEFLVKDANRVEEGLRLINEEGAPPVSLPSVLLAGLKVDYPAYLDKSLDIILDTSEPDIVRGNAVSIFSNIGYFQQDPLCANRILCALEDLCKRKQSEVILGQIPCSAVACAVKNPLLEGRVQKLINIVATTNLPAVLYGMSRSYVLFSGHISISISKCLLDGLAQTLPEHKGILRNIDYLLTRLLGAKHGDEVLDFIFDYLVRNDGMVCITEFSSFIEALAKNGEGVLDQFVTRCFLSRDSSHHDAIAHFVEHFHGRPSFDVKMDTAQLFEPINIVALFLARKAIGYLYLMPETCVAYVVSTLDAMEPAERKELLQIFINPFALSYLECVKKFAVRSDIQLSKTEKDFLKKTVSITNKFFKDVKQIGEVKELLPTVKNREIYNRQFRRKMEQAFREAKKNSLVDAICTSVNLLHGHGWVRYDENADNRSVNFMQSMSTACSIPALWSADPHGFDYVLRICRVERIIK